ncbi:restriction endonuclease [Campylobacter sp. RM12654]|nr:restriction endonuclease [Campylobacter sp. RM12654]
MNRLFEDYVAFMLKKHNPNIKISAQLLKKHLIKDGQNERCLMRPDILIELKDKTIIADTKYKIINKLSDISQADLYQLFAYAIAFKVSEVWLIYPLFDGSLGYKTLEYNLDCFNTKIKLQILFAPLG